MIEIKRFVNAFEQGCAGQIMQINNQLGKGQIASIEEYKLKVGERRGLEAAAGLARDMLRQLEIAEDQGPGEPPAGGGQQ